MQYISVANRGSTALFWLWSSTNLLYVSQLIVLSTKCSSVNLTGTLASMVSIITKRRFQNTLIAELMDLQIIKVTLWAQVVMSTMPNALWKQKSWIWQRSSGLMVQTIPLAQSEFNSLSKTDLTSALKPKSGNSKMETIRLSIPCWRLISSSMELQSILWILIFVAKINQY